MVERLADAVLEALDDIEGYRPDDPDKSLYSRDRASVRVEYPKFQALRMHVLCVREQPFAMSLTLVRRRDVQVLQPSVLSGSEADDHTVVLDNPHVSAANQVRQELKVLVLAVQTG